MTEKKILKKDEKNVSKLKFSEFSAQLNSTIFFRNDKTFNYFENNLTQRNSSLKIIKISKHIFA